MKRLLSSVKMKQNVCLIFVDRGVQSRNEDARFKWSTFTPSNLAAFDSFLQWRNEQDCAAILGHITHLARPSVSPVLPSSYWLGNKKDVYGKPKTALNVFLLRGTGAPVFSSKVKGQGHKTMRTLKLTISEVRVSRISSRPHGSGASGGSSADCKLSLLHAETKLGAAEAICQSNYPLWLSTTAACRRPEIIRIRFSAHSHWLLFHLLLRRKLHLLV